MSTMIFLIGQSPVWSITAGNVNQITRRCNETRNLYAQDVEDLRQGYDRVWHEVYDLIRKFEGL